MLAAHAARGELLACGLGYCLPKDYLNPLARLYSFGTLLPKNAVLCGLSAAWVWGCLPQLPETITLNQSPSASKIASTGSNQKLCYARYRWQEIAHFDGFLVTLPQRTLYDLLFARDFHKSQQQAASALLTLCNSDNEQLRKQLLKAKHPGKRIALANLTTLDSLYTIHVVNPLNPAHSF